MTKGGFGNGGWEVGIDGTRLQHRRQKDNGKFPGIVGTGVVAAHLVLIFCLQLVMIEIDVKRILVGRQQGSWQKLN